MPSEDTHQGHRKRLREKFLKSGLAGFHDYEIVELLLSLGTPRRDCKLSAKEAIKKLEAERIRLINEWGIDPIPNEDLPPKETLGFRVQRYGMLK